MPWSFIIPAAVSLFSGSQNRQAASQASDAATQASERASALQYQMYKEQQALQEPWRAAGANALAKLQGVVDYTPFGEAQFQRDPGYGFRLSEGMKQLGHNASRGGLISGGTMKGLQDYAQNSASQEYGNAFNRYQTERAARLQPLQSLAGLGQTSANTLGQMAGNYGANVGNLYQQQGENQANALLAAQKSNASTYGDIAKLYGQTNPNFGKLFGSSSISDNGFYTT